jgi:hypothetical protein
VAHLGTQRIGRVTLWSVDCPWLGGLLADGDGSQDQFIDGNGGPLFEELQRRAEALQLTNIEFRGYMPEKQLVARINAAEATEATNIA